MSTPNDNPETNETTHHLSNPEAATKLSKREFLDTLRHTFDSPGGRIILAWLHATAATRKPCFLPIANGVPCDPYTAASRDGRKSLVWEIEANLEEARAGDTSGPVATSGKPPRTRRQRS